MSEIKTTEFVIAIYSRKVDSHGPRKEFEHFQIISSNYTSVALTDFFWTRPGFWDLYLRYPIHEGYVWEIMKSETPTKLAIPLQFNLNFAP